MESFGGYGFSHTSKTVRKKRSNPPRRPWNDSQSVNSSMPPSDSGGQASSDENTDHGTNSRSKELNLNQCSLRASYTNVVEAENALKVSDKDVGFEESDEARINGVSESKDSCMDSKRSIDVEMCLRTRDTPISGRISCNHSSEQSEVVSDVQGNENKLKKVKLKLGGVTRTIHSKSISDGTSGGESSSIKSSRSSDATRPRKNLIVQVNSDDDHCPSPDKGSSLRGVPWKDFSRSGFSVRKLDSSRGKIPEESVPIEQSDKYEPVRKSKRVPKRRLLDGAFSDGDDDEEIRYLEKLKTSQVADYSSECEDDEVGSKKQLKISRILNRNVDTRDYGSSRPGKEGRKSRSGRVYEDTDYVEEEELASDGELESKRKKQRKEFADVLGDSTREMAVTTRQRALQTGKDTSSGLPPAPPRKQKEKLSEVEQQLKKAEAAQKRRMQMEKAARESEAEAIRKILGQDSSRKKREHKIKQRQEELAQERTANAMTLASNTVRWIMGPTGTVVTFPDDVGLPSILEPKSCSYPPPREKCAGPFCTNPYKYRDSKSKLPLCSLQCYKAIHEKMQPLTSC